MRITISDRQLLQLQARKAELDQAVAAANGANARLADVIAAIADKDMTSFVGFNFGRDEAPFLLLEEKPAEVKPDGSV